MNKLLTKKAIFLSAIVSSLLIAPVSVSAAITDQQMLLKADQARGNLSGVVWNVAIQHEANARNKGMTLNVKSRGFDVLAKYLAPARNKGNKLLMANGNMWFYKPSLSKPVPISRRQKLLGNAAYGDIAATDYANSYKISKVEDTTVSGEACKKFRLVSNNKKNTYDLIDYWVSSQRHIAVKAHYYTVSGKLFKTAIMEHNNSVTINDVSQPFISKIVISDTLVSKSKTIMKFSKAKIRKINDYEFNVSFLRR